MSDLFFKLLNEKDPKNKDLIKKRLFGTLQQNVSFILGLISYSYIIYLNWDDFLNLHSNLILVFFLIIPTLIILAIFCVLIYKLINSLRHYKRDWRVLLLYSVFIISFLSNKYYFQNELGDYKIAFSVSFIVFIIICIFYGGINKDFGED